MQFIAALQVQRAISAYHQRSVCILAYQLGSQRLVVCCMAENDMMHYCFSHGTVRLDAMVIDCGNDAAATFLEYITSAAVGALRMSCCSSHALLLS